MSARRLGVTLIAALALAAPLAAQQPSAVGTIVIAHGGGPVWDGHVKSVVGQVETGGPVEVSFLMGPGAAQHRFQDAARRLVERGAREIVVVPLLVSSHSGHYEQIRWLTGGTETISETMMHHLHMSGIERANVTVPIRLAPAIDDAPEAAAVLADRARALASRPSEQALFLIGHGPNSAEDNAEWMSNLRRVAERVRETSGFKSVRVGLVRDDAPPPVRAEAVMGIRETIALQHEATGQPVVVVPILISSGEVSARKLPADLDGLPVVYEGTPLLPHAEMARWVESRVRGPKP
jgi:sirohydrochlorin ferrochelatase